MRRLLAPALLLAAALAPPAPSRAAEAGADPDIQATITSQIEAFGRGDADTAER